VDDPAHAWWASFISSPYGDVADSRPPPGEVGQLAYCRVALAIDFAGSGAAEYRGRPPAGSHHSEQAAFRADHVGSLLRPPALKKRERRSKATCSAR
jgi:hypothetical protein